MPLPFVVGAAALAAAAYGAKKGYDGYQKHSEAGEIVKTANAKYSRSREYFDEQEAGANGALELLGKKELKIGKSISDFKELADDLLRQLGKNEGGKALTINTQKHTLQKIEAYAYTATGVLATMAGAGASAAAAGFATYGGVMALGTASTGTAISALSGAAATKATLAALGGGSLAAGGMGMAGGMAVLGAAVAAPIIAVAGVAYDSHGDRSLENAQKVRNEVDEIVVKLRKGGDVFEDIEEYAGKIKKVLSRVYGQFLGYHQSLKDINDFIVDVRGRVEDVDAELEKFNDDVMLQIENGYALAAIMVDIISTPIFKMKKKGGVVVVDENNVPQMDLDEDGFNQVNVTEIEKALRGGMEKSSAF